MKMIRFVVIAAIMTCSITSCQAQGKKKVTDKTFQIFLNKFKTIVPPFNYKKLSDNSLMTKEEAIRFLHKTEDDLYYIVQEMGEDETGNEILDETIEEHTAGCDFKYLLNDSIYILCTREGSQENVGDPFGTIQITRVCLNSFTMRGELSNKCVVGEQFTFESDWVSFVLLDKRHIRVFYYADNNEREREGFLSTVYYVNYKITEDGNFVEKDKSGITYLKNPVNYYSIYDPKSDDPMNEYDY